MGIRTASCCLLQHGRGKARGSVQARIGAHVILRAVSVFPERKHCGINGLAHPNTRQLAKLSLMLALLALLLSLPLGLELAALGDSNSGASLVDDTYCSEAVLADPTHVLDFDCLRDANASTAAVKILLGPGSASVASAAACKALCAGYGYRGLPCRSYTFFATDHPRPAFRSRCYGRVDDLLPSSPDPHATSSSIG